MSFQSFKPFLTLILTSVTALTFATVSRAEDYTPEQLAFFEKNIRPALVKYCYECHSVEEGTTRGGLLLDTRLGWLEGGDSGPAIEPGNLAGSLFWEAITWEGEEMPPSKKMPGEVIAHFKTWIEMGAPDPREREKMFYKAIITEEKIEEGKKFWAFQKPEPASGKKTIDDLIDRKLADAGLSPVESADVFTLLRRMNYDLIGLPPTADEVQKFEVAWQLDQGKAIEAKIDELLARPQFGERWGRHWLDVARYAESSGTVNVIYPHAWRYRDYVIDSFNKDKPYDQFITEQIAGDLLPADSKEERQKNLIATGYLAVGMKRQDERNPRQFQMDMIDEQIDMVSQSVLGLTVACARCHDHKSDPIPTADYYALAGIFKSTNTMYGTVFGQQNHRPAELIDLPIADPVHQAGKIDTDRVRQQLSTLNDVRRKMRDEARQTGNTDPGKFVILRNQMARLRGLLETVDKDGVPLTFGMGVMEADRMATTRILIAGDIEKPAQDVKRGFLRVLADVPAGKIDEKESGRLQLAQWLTAKENPLTARVMMNRVWMHLMGSPLVATPNNWGPSGLKPTHPQLLDALAVQFMAEDWSIKSMVKRIMLSKTYQRGSDYHAGNYAVDPDNNLQWRHSPRHLDAEAMRDSVLAASSQLKLNRPFGSEVAELRNGRFGREFNSDSFSKHNRHRSVYMPVIRDHVHESLKLFDFPDPNAAAGERASSVVATQALYIMNSEFMRTQAKLMATELLGEHRSLRKQVAAAFMRVYGRPATSDEITASVSFINRVDPGAYSMLTESESSTRTTTVDDLAERSAFRRMIEERERKQRRQRRERMAEFERRQREQQTKGNSMDDRKADFLMRRIREAAKGGGRQRGVRQTERAKQDAAEMAKALAAAEDTPLGLTLFCQSLLASSEFRILD